MTDKKLDAKRLAFIITFTLCSIGINYLGSVLAGLIAFPLYLDSVMTIAVTALCGFIPGLICAIGSNTLLYFFAHTGILFTISHISTVVVAYVFFKHEEKSKLKNNRSFLHSSSCFMWIGFVAAITNSILGDTISAIFYRANTSIPQVDNAVQGIYVVIRNLTVAAYIGGTLTNLVDKIISAAVSYGVYMGVMKLRKKKIL